MWNCKNLKIKELSKIDLELKYFGSPLSHINGVKCTWGIKKNCSLLYKKT